MRRPRLVRAGLIFLAIVASIPLIPSPAAAATAAVVSHELLIGGKPGEANDIVVQLVDKRFLISDSAGVEAGAGCTDQEGTVSCRAKDVLLVVIHTRDLDDQVRVIGIESYVEGGGGNDRLSADDLNATLVGGPGNDTLEGGTGNDLLRGGGGEDHLVGDGGSDDLKAGAGQDTLHSRDNRRDIVSGGGGTDEGNVDSKDKVRRVEVLGDF